MDLKKLKKLIVLLIILTLIIIISIFMLQKMNKNVTTSDFSDDDGYVPVKVATTLQDINVYTKIKNHLSTLLLYKSGGNTTAVEEITGNKDSFSELTIDLDNPIMLDIVYRTGDTMNNVNFVKFKFYKQNESYYAVVILDKEKGTYKILESNAGEYENAKNENIDAKYSKKMSIAETKYNKIKEQPQLSEDEVIKEYFKDYIQKALYYPQEAYSSLNLEYSKKRFGSFEKYQEYLKENREKLETLDIYSIKSREDFSNAEEYKNYMINLSIKDLRKYQAKMYDDYTEYTCIDDYGDYYIFKVKGAMQYEVYLDNYTIDLPSIIEQYNLLTRQEKATFNINKFLNAVDNKDYSYAYSKLAQEFKSNYLPTEDKFIEQVQNSWIEYDNIESVNVEERDEQYYICKVKTKDENTKQFIMKLNEGLDFVMSFGI